MPRRHFALPVACFCPTTLALLLLAAPAAAQDRPRILPTDGEQAFLKEHARQKATFDSIKKPIEGEKANKDSPEHQKAIDVMAQYYTYQLTWDKNATPGEVHKLWEEFQLQVNSADSDAMRKGNPAFTEMYLKALAQRARDVMLTKQPIAAVNAGRMLARLAKAGSEEAGDACLEAVNDKKNLLEPRARMGVQYWALQGLGNLLARWADVPADNPLPPATRAKEEEYLKALVQTIQRNEATGPVKPTPDEVAGMQVFRREAVQALTQYRLPAVVGAKDAIQVPTALALLKVVNDDGLSPHVRLDEQIEAAVGIARLPSRPVAAYQPDYAAKQIGYLAVEMVRHAQEDNPPKFAWKISSARLADALEAMRADAKRGPDKAAAAYIDKMVTLALRVLKDVEVAKKATGNSASDLKRFLDDTPTPHNTLYKGLADSTVRPYEKPDEPEKPAEKKPDDKPKKPENKPKKPGDKPGKSDENKGKKP